MSGPTDFARLVRLQRAVKAVRERELAEARNRVAAAQNELKDLQRMTEGENAILDLFPEIVARRLDRTLAAKVEAERLVSETGGHLLREKRKLESIESRHAEQRAFDLRENEASAQSETIDQRLSRYLSASSKIGGLG